MDQQPFIYSLITFTKSTGGEYCFMKRGISFQLPNTNNYDSCLGDVLKPIDLSTFDWRVSPVESYLVVNDELDLDQDLLKQIMK